MQSEPPALPPSPTIEQVIQAVNQNNSRIQTFTTNQAALSVPGWPTLPASVVFERPGRLRIRGDTGLTGPEIDLGSNDELFWFWVRRNQPPAIFFCRHDQFATCPARQMIPIEPKWLIEALGVAELDPRLPYQGPPQLIGPDRLEIRAVRETPNGPTTKITRIDAVPGVYPRARRLRRPRPPAGQRDCRGLSSRSLDGAGHAHRRADLRAAGPAFAADRVGRRRDQPFRKQSGVVGDAAVGRLPGRRLVRSASAVVPPRRCTAPGGAIGACGDVAIAKPQACRIACPSPWSLVPGPRSLAPGPYFAPSDCKNAPV